MRDDGYDVIVVGGGTSGAVLAARLSEDPTRRVLLLEAGPDDGDYSDAIRTPHREYDVVLSDPLGTRWSMALAPGATPTPVVRGSVLGGTSAVNFMAAVRGQPEDYDRWAALGLDGWAWAQVLPAFIRAENDLDLGHRPLHGATGPLTLRRWREAELSAPHRAVLDGARELGITEVDDVNDRRRLPGIGMFPGTVQDGGSRRLTVSEAYLPPQVRARPNLVITTGVLVRRVRLDRDRVRGVELDGGTSIGADEVVLCAGAFESPRLLLASGIGPGDDVARLGVVPAVESPGVGRNLSDHIGAGLLYRTPTGESLWGSPAKVIWIGDSGGGQGIDFHLLCCPISSTPNAGTLFQLFALHLAPRSTGTLRYRSLDPATPPELDSAFLTDADDRRDHARILSIVADWEDTQAFAQLDATRIQPLGDLRDPTAVEAALRTSLFSYFHQTGTCAMGTGDAVLDRSCRVRGVQGLRVVDASAMPTIVRGNTYLGCVMMAERVAEMMASG